MTNIDEYEGLLWWSTVELQVIEVIVNQPEAPEFFYGPSGLAGASFWNTEARDVYLAAQGLHEAGGRIDVVSVADALRGKSSVDLERLYELIESDRPWLPKKAWESAAEKITQAAVRRNASIEASSLVKALRDPQVPFRTALAKAEKLNDSALRSLAARSDTVEGLYLAGHYDIMAEGEEMGEAPWVIPFLLRKGERLMVVADGGLGKSALLRTLAYGAVNQVHALSGYRMKFPAQKALVIELEAPKRGIANFGAKCAWHLTQLTGSKRPEAPMVLHREGGIDLRDPQDRGGLERVLDKHRPDLVCVGPLKYLYSQKASERDDLVALEVQRVMNKLAATYGFALAIEAHTNAATDEKPAGAKSWTHWPDVGIAMLDQGSDDGDGRKTRTIQHASDSGELLLRQFRVPRNDETIVDASIFRNYPGTGMPFEFASSDLRATIRENLKRAGWLHGS